MRKPRFLIFFFVCVLVFTTTSSFARTGSNLWRSFSDSKAAIPATVISEKSRVKELENRNIASEIERNLTVSINIISLLSLAVLILFIYHREKKLKIRQIQAEQLAQSKIDKLNLASQIQIAELQERNRLEKQMEQKRFGMELHDDVAGLLASAKLRLDQEMLQCESPAQNRRLEIIARILDLAYRDIRLKSHGFYKLAEEGEEASFSERIDAILENALPQELFETEIVIDDHSLKNISHHVKIELLRIVQEAVVNVIKHSKASKISIMLYREVNALVMHIKDDGKGFNTELVAKGLGLKSIHDRVRGIEGIVNIKSDDGGTEMVVEIPV
ncbi:sensor histidine kinase [Dyadobacter psychrotolerans]|uniref:histidine kinase n=1 Tax=Dyadobacter psychrotolerans TaxID=2541721 RepID=A0A4R5DLL7_9BACT|nr:ATP-binding protein [Dyadobacter psychrotolerans]TDE12934.1 hypothetical protein E0F88_21610 [Dyadobacter psychrotolerans]